MYSNMYGKLSRHYAAIFLVVLFIAACPRGAISQAVGVDQSLRNLKFIESKIIPDKGAIAQARLPPADEEFSLRLNRFVEDGFQVLELNGFKPKKDVPFTLIVPKIDLRTIEMLRMKEFMQEHLVPGKAFDSYSGDEQFGNSNGHKITFRKLEDSHNNQWLLNGIQILKKIKIGENLVAISIDGYLGDRKSPYSKRNIQETNSRYNEPQPLEMRNATAHTKNEPVLKESRSSPLMSFLSSMKTGTKVFQHFLSKSNLTQVMDDRKYTVLIPADNAFQRWHPIDWGFYPFSVQEFTESVLRNHFLPTARPIRMADVKSTDHMIVRTMGGENVVFRNSPTPSVNNVSIISDYTLSNGNQVFIISEILFVSESVVSKLHQMHKDKETPPLLAFPWFGAQFLSHSFLALEKDPRFTHITRYLNNAEIAPHVSGANYTFFVPDDRAFERIGFSRISDEVLASPRGVKMLLNHFVRGRLYDRDFKDGGVFEAIGGGLLKIYRGSGKNVSVNNAHIIESEVFVYNLGTMFYVDEVLSSNLLTSSKPEDSSFVSSGAIETTTLATPTDVEIVPNEFFTEVSSGGEFAMHDEEMEDEIITPKALPFRSNYELLK